MQESECTQKVAVNCEHGERGKRKRATLSKGMSDLVCLNWQLGSFIRVAEFFFGYFCYIHCLGTCLTLFTLFHPSTVRMMLIISRISFSCAIKRQKRRVQEPFICLPMLFAPPSLTSRGAQIAERKSASSFASFLLFLGTLISVCHYSGALSGSNSIPSQVESSSRPNSRKAIYFDLIWENEEKKKKRIKKRKKQSTANGDRGTSGLDKVDEDVKM